MERPINAGPKGGDDKRNAEKTRGGRSFEKRRALGGGGAHKLGMPLRAQDRVVMGVTLALGRIGHARCYNITPDKDKGCFRSEDVLSFSRMRERGVPQRSWRELEAL